MTSADAAEPSELPPAEESAEQSRIVTALPRLDTTVIASRFESDAPGALVMGDGRRGGATPLAILLEPGDHAVAVAAPNRITTGETVHVPSDAPVARHFRLDALPKEAPADRSASEPAPLLGRAPAAASESATELLAAARERRARADGDGAMTAYRELFGRYPRSAEAPAALVPFGEILLGRSDARTALDAFDRYLTRGGALEEEARFGRVRALRMLGRAPEERAAIEAMIERFPSGALATSLRDRLHALTREPR
jgi:hypothetical protein